MSSQSTFRSEPAGQGVSRRVALAAAMLGGTAAVSGTARAGGSDGDASLRAVLEELRVAMERGDGPTLARLLHPDLVYMHSSGFSQTKEIVMRDLAGKQFFAAFTASDIDVRRAGNTGVTTMTVDQVKNLSGGKTRASRIKVIYTWVLQGRQWQLLGRCSAMMVPGPSSCRPVSGTAG